jgi:signal transduction histidine kinase/CheY-like chemotaxis protein/HPt (histidine-containing phosphotransfer) domain-containing protein
MRDTAELPPAETLHHPAPRRALQRQILLGGLVLIGLLWFSQLSQLDQEREAALGQAMRDGCNLALAFEEQARRAIAGLDQILLFLKAEFEADPEGFSVARWRDRLPQLSEVDMSLSQVGPDGRLQATLQGPATEPRDFTDRDHFVAHAAADTRRLFIGRPIVGHSSGRPTVTLSRRISFADGSFAGVLSIGIDPMQLTRFREEVDLGQDGAVLLVGLDGVVRARAGLAPAPMGQDLGATPLFAAVRTAIRGSWTGEAGDDGVARVWAFKHIAGLPLVVLVGIGQDEAQAALVARERTVLLLTTLISVALMSLLGALVLEINRRQRREEELRRERIGLEAANRELAQAKYGADDKTNLLEATLVNMTDGISVFDRDLRLVTWNQRFIDLVGVDAGVLKTGVPYEAILRVQAISGEFGQVDTDEEVRRRMDRVREGKFVHLERTRADGRTVEMRRRYLPDGGFATLYSDITDRKRAETEMRRSRELAEAASAAKSAFVAVVSHEIRTPMNAVLGTLGLLAETPLDTDQRTYVDTARGAADALLGIINDILDLSKIEAGKLELEPGDFALQPLVSGVIDLFRASAKERGIALSWGVAQDLPPLLRSDPGRLRQVLLNLLSNAVKFSQHGDVVLTVTRDMSSGQPMIRFAVADSGPGIPISSREKLFQPFSQLQAPDRRNTGGTGLGLAICRRLVELFGGRIGVSDRPAGGSVFWFTIPLQPAATPERAMEVAAAPQAPERARVLLVEDSPANQLVAATWLRRAGHRVDIAGNGIEAVAAMGERPYDLVFMDVFMPEMDGIEATRRIRALATPAAHTPIIALTANVMAGDRERFVAAGMNGVLPKPVTGRMLLDALARHAGTQDSVAARAPQPARALPEATPPAAPEAPPQGDELPDLDAAAFDRVRRGLPPQTVITLIETCAAELAERANALDEAALLADLERIAHEAHALAGGAANYGMARLAARARALERAARADDADTAQSAKALRPVIAAAIVALSARAPRAAAAQ